MYAYYLIAESMVRLRIHATMNQASQHGMIPCLIEYE